MVEAGLGSRAPEAAPAGTAAGIKTAEARTMAGDEETGAEVKDLKTSLAARVNAVGPELKKARGGTGAKPEARAAKAARLESAAGPAADAADWSKPRGEPDSGYGVNPETRRRRPEELDPKNAIVLDLWDLAKIPVNEDRPATTLKSFKAGS